MKKCIIVLICWFLFVNSSEPTDKWAKLPWSDENTIHKCKRENYLELIELSMMEDERIEEIVKEEKYKNDSIAYQENYKVSFGKYLDNRKETKQKADSIMFEFHKNYTTFNEYCINYECR